MRWAARLYPLVNISPFRALAWLAETRPCMSPETVANNLIQSLAMSERSKLCALLEPWRGEPGAVIYEPGDDVQYAYFPVGASMASFRIILLDGGNVETGLVGREGAVGGIVSKGRLPAYARAVVQFGSQFARVRISHLERLKGDNPAIDSLFARYADCLMAQIFQSTACNASHGIEQRAAKWLLAAADRTGDSSLSLTQEQLAGLLGVGRSYVNRLLQRFRNDGVLDLRRSMVIIKDESALKRLSCECNASLRRHFEAVLRDVYPSDHDTTH